MKCLCVIVLSASILKRVDVSSVTLSTVNETLASSSLPSNSSINGTLEPKLSSAELEARMRMHPVYSTIPSHGILQLIKRRLEHDKLEYVEDALSKIYQILNLSLPVCNYPAGSKEALLLQYEGVRNKTQELEIYEGLISAKQLLELIENMFLYGLKRLDPVERIIKDDFENCTDPVHYLRWKRFFNECKNHAEIRKLETIFDHNSSAIDDFCRYVDEIFSYSYGGIESIASGLCIVAMDEVKERLLRDSEKYASEIKVVDALIRLGRNKEFIRLFDEGTPDPHDAFFTTSQTPNWY